VTIYVGPALSTTWRLPSRCEKLFFPLHGADELECLFSFRALVGGRGLGAKFPSSFPGLAVGLPGIEANLSPPFPGEDDFDAVLTFLGVGEDTFSLCRCIPWHSAFFCGCCHSFASAFFEFVTGLFQRPAPSPVLKLSFFFPQPALFGRNMGDSGIGGEAAAPSLRCVLFPGETLPSTVAFFTK